jgi:hypothetical protein
MRVPLGHRLVTDIPAGLNELAMLGSEARYPFEEFMALPVPDPQAPFVLRNVTSLGLLAPEEIWELTL